MKQPTPDDAYASSALFDQKLAELEGWRGSTLRRVRSLIHKAAFKALVGAAAALNAAGSKKKGKPTS